MENAKTVSALLDAAPLSGDDLMPVSQPGVYNPITQQNGDTRKIKVKKLIDHFSKEAGIPGIVTKLEDLEEQLGLIESGSGALQTPIGLVVSSTPNKTAYQQGDTFVSTGLVVKALFDGMLEQVVYPESPAVSGINGYLLSTPDMATVGQKQITVAYRGVTTTFVIEVFSVLPTATITGIEITTPPNKTTYETGELLDLSGMVIKAVFSDGSKTVLSHDSGGVSGYKTSSPDMSAVGSKTVTVSYTPGATTFTQTFTIDVQQGSDWDGVVDNVTETNQNLLTVFGVSTYQEVWEITHQRINADGLSNYHGMGLGDYFDITGGLPAPANIAWNASHQNLRMYILGFNIHKGSQGNTKNNILWGWKNIPHVGAMNTTSTNAGGYPATNVAKSWIDSTFLPSLIAALGADYLYDLKRLISTHGGTASPTTTVMQAKCWLPNEQEIFGTSAPVGETFKGNDPSPQVVIPLYAKSTAHRLKNSAGVAQWWWEATPYAGDVNGFCIVGSGGGKIDYNDATLSMRGIVPHFCQI